MQNSNDGRVDYSKYDEAQLLEVFDTLSRERYPVNFSRLWERLESLGYRLADSQGYQLIAPPEAAARLQALRSAQELRVVRPRKLRLAWILFAIAAAFLANGIYQLETQFEYSAIAGLFLSDVAAIFVGAFGVVLFFEAYRERSAQWWSQVLKFSLGIILWCMTALVVLYAYRAIERHI